MRRRHRLALGAVFGATGFSALCLQVVWQRVVSLHAGVDLVSFTTIIAAFLAGLGVGNLLGGGLADRLGPRRALLAFAAANLGIGTYAWFSLDLLYDLYRDVAPDVSGAGAKFAFNVALLLVPTTLMGLSLPLAAKVVVERVAEAGPLVGRLYAVNTVGAAAGAAVSGWFLVGALGFTATVRIAGGLNLLAAVAVVLLWRAAGLSAAGHQAAVDRAPTPVADGSAGARVWPWFLVYALTGAVALGFELVFFRIVDAVMRSNSYSFPHVLFLYLSLFGLGSALGARHLARTGDPATGFLSLQFGVGVSALLGIVLLGRIGPALFGSQLDTYFCCDGFNVGFSQVDSPGFFAHLVFAWLLAPLLIMGLPVLLMGASFPFVQALVAQRLDSLGRRTGTLLTANIAGNVAGTTLVGFVLLDRLGTIGTARLLAGLLVIPGVAAATRLDRRRTAAVVGSAATIALLAAAAPSNHQWWATLHGVGTDELALVERRSCVVSAKEQADGTFLYINASSQNGHPFDDFHVLIGLAPTLLHPQPDDALVIGIGIGSTPWSVGLDPRVERLDAVEICGGQIELMADLAADGIPEHQRLVSDERVRLLEGDGRDHLLRTDRRFDLINVDTLRPQSAFSGSLYSEEFYELVASRLDDDGVFTQWIASPRTFNGITAVFPHVLVFDVASYSSAFVVASNAPIPWDRAEVTGRFDDLVPADAVEAVQFQRLADYFSTVEPRCGRAGSVAGRVPDDATNDDLHPRDEYFLNQSTGSVPTRAGC